jgi:hypothetical protein
MATTRILRVLVLKRNQNAPSLAPHDSEMYVRWYADLLWIFVPIQGKVAEFAATLKDYPPVMGGSLSGGLSYKTVQIQNGRVPRSIVRALAWHDQARDRL